jgi:hypothetical protein
MTNIEPLSFTDKPWQAIKPVNPPGGSIPSMICHEERRYLQWLAQERYTGAGVIVDCGPLLGGSTAALAEGLRRNPHVADAEKAGKIRSYDLFEYYPYMKGLFKGEPEPAPKESLVPRFLANTEQWRPLIQLHPGDVRQFAWTGEPIELLFIDLAKSWTLQAHLLREFFPALIPGVSVIVQQDYFFHGCPWILVVMECLADYVTPVHGLDQSTLGFVLDRAIPGDLLRVDYERELSATDKRRLIEQAVQRFAGAHRLVVMTAQATLEFELGDVDAAVDTLGAVRQSAIYDPTVAPHLLRAAQFFAARLPREHAARRLVDPLLADVSLEVALRSSAMTPQASRAMSSIRRATAAGRPLYLWGAGAAGQQALKMLQSHHVPVGGFVDRDPGKHGTTVNGLTVHSPSCLDRSAELHPFVAACGTFATEIAAALDAQGWTPNTDYAVW